MSSKKFFAEVSVELPSPGPAGAKTFANHTTPLFQREREDVSSCFTEVRLSCGRPAPAAGARCRVFVVKREREIKRENGIRDTCHRNQVRSSLSSSGGRIAALPNGKRERGQVACVRERGFLDEGHPSPCKVLRPPSRGSDTE